MKSVVIGRWGLLILRLPDVKPPCTNCPLIPWVGGHLFSRLGLHAWERTGRRTGLDQLARHVPDRSAGGAGRGRGAPPPAPGRRREPRFSARGDPQESPAKTVDCRSFRPGLSAILGWSHRAVSRHGKTAPVGCFDACSGSPSDSAWLQNAVVVRSLPAVSDRSGNRPTNTAARGAPPALRARKRLHEAHHWRDPSGDGRCAR